VCMHVHVQQRKERAKTANAELRSTWQTRSGLFTVCANSNAVASIARMSAMFFLPATQLFEAHSARSRQQAR